MTSGASDLNVLLGGGDDDDVEQTRRLLQGPTGTRCQRPPWMVPAACLVGVGALGCLSSTLWAPSTSPARARPDGVTGLIEAGSDEYVRIVWAPRPYKCIEVKVGEKETFGVPEIWECSDTSDTFIVPAPGETGPIQWAKHPELCLDAPGGSQLQLWHCGKAPRENTRFVMPEGGRGAIRWAAHPDKCINVPGNEDRNGAWLRIWNCSKVKGEDADKDMEFALAPAVNYTQSSIASVACYVQNLNYGQLLANQQLFQRFDLTVKDSIATALGGETSSDQVALSTSGGAERTSTAGVNIDAVIALGDGVNDPDLESKLKDSNAISNTLMRELNALSDLFLVCDGPIAAGCHKIDIHLSNHNETTSLPRSAGAGLGLPRLLITAAGLGLALGALPR